MLTPLQLLRCRALKWLVDSIYQIYSYPVRLLAATGCDTVARLKQPFWLNSPNQGVPKLPSIYGVSRPGR